MKLKILFFAVLLPLMSFSQGIKYNPGKIVLVNHDTVPATGSLNMDVNMLTVWDGGAWANDPEPDTVPDRNALSFGGEYISPGLQIKGSEPTIFLRQQKCKCETIRDTTVHNEGSANCAHDWVFASHEEVNEPPSMITTLELRSCPKDQTTNSGKICSKCLRHEIEHVTENWSVDHEKSKYRQLVEQSEKRQ